MSAALFALGLLRRFWPYALCGAALIGAVLWIDHRGYRRGVAYIEARDAKAVARIEAARARLVAAFDRVAGAHAATAQMQQSEVREIYHEATRIIDRSVYHAVCIDADGAGLLDRARASANRGLTGEPAGGAAGPAALPAER